MICKPFFFHFFYDRGTFEIAKSTLEKRNKTLIAFFAIYSCAYKHDADICIINFTLLSRTCTFWDRYVLCDNTLLYEIKFNINRTLSRKSRKWSTQEFYEKEHLNFEKNISKCLSVKDIIKTFRMLFLKIFNYMRNLVSLDMI